MHVDKSKQNKYIFLYDDMFVFCVLEDIIDTVDYRPHQLINWTLSEQVGVI